MKTTPHSSFAIRHPSFRRAFTIVELLVVVSIISLLMALMLPALGKARGEAKTVVCKTNIRSLNQALHLYFTENNGAVPINGILFPKSGVPTIYSTPPNNRYKNAEVTDPQKWRLEYGVLWNEMGNSLDVSTLTPPLPAYAPTQARKFMCPDDVTNNGYRGNPIAGAPNAALTMQTQPDGTSVVTFGQGSGGYWSYSVNAVLNSLGRFRNNPKFQVGGNTVLPWQDPIMYTTIKSPENFITFAEEDKNSLFNDEVFEPPTFRTDPATGLPNSNNTERLTDRHNGGGNVGFADGHVDWFNEIVFDNGPTTNSISRLFFPDGGEFLSGP